jgi:hypothetical protein
LLLDKHGVSFFIQFFRKRVSYRQQHAFARALNGRYFFDASRGLAIQASAVMVASVFDRARNAGILFPIVGFIKPVSLDLVDAGFYVPYRKRSVPDKLHAGIKRTVRRDRYLLFSKLAPFLTAPSSYMA